jgi:hypothetical protein
MRRHFELSEEDEGYLKARGLEWETVIEGQAKWLIILNYPIPSGYNHTTANVALRIKPSYPDDDIDMAYFLPALALTSRKAIRQLSACSVGGAQYQQWSRHRTPQNPWRPGIDNVGTHMVAVDDWLKREIAA